MEAAPDPADEADQAVNEHPRHGDRSEADKRNRCKHPPSSVCQLRLKKFLAIGRAGTDQGLASRVVLVDGLEKQVERPKTPYYRPNR